MKKLIFLSITLLLFGFSSPSYKIAVLKYYGGGDWYSNPTALNNLILFCNENLGTNINKKYDIVDVGSSDIFNYPFIHMTGHGNVIFSSEESDNLRKYLIGGGFLHIDDNYGMDKFIRPEINKIFPESEFVELPYSHPIYHQTYDFNNGLPKVHEHDAKPSQGFGVFHEGRMVVFYSYESDLGDGWEDPEVHNDSPEIRLKALKMGANIIDFVFSNQN
ncbi:MAG: DUF4159 domain-containing protein [Flavobacteriales bacterium]|jgi:hypothetical protein|nr:DUF4159 domain-containing protein [Flavobacteriales bacterium]|tara:strand:- start:6614 stop:7267 length:654 start_codon:yes stop_codon:yes gene_type:complete